MTRILVIESEAPSRHALRHILEGAGYDVEVAADDSHAAEAHDRHPVDLVIADPDDVHARARFAGARLLALPSHQARRERRDSESASGLETQHMLRKPFRRDELLAAVRSTLGAA
jgi:DNA-binding response OmpR family regulator